MQWMPFRQRLFVIDMHPLAQPCINANCPGQRR